MLDLLRRPPAADKQRAPLATAGAFLSASAGDGYAVPIWAARITLRQPRALTRAYGHAALQSACTRLEKSAMFNLHRDGETRHGRIKGRRLQPFRHRALHRC